MNNIEIKNIENELNKLGSFMASKMPGEEIGEKEIIDWLADSLVIFSKIGIDQTIIDNFLNHFRFHQEKILYKKGVVIPGISDGFVETLINKIGPFSEVVVYDEISDSATDIRRHSYYLTGSFYYTKIYFAIARSILKNKADEKKLVSQSLIDAIKQESKYGNLGSGLENINRKIADSDVDGIVQELNIILDNFLSLIPELNKVGNLNKKFSKLQSDEELRNKINVSLDMVNALNNSRVIRNDQKVHPKMNINYNIPLMAAVSCAQLGILFIESVLSTGEIS